MAAMKFIPHVAGGADVYASPPKPAPVEAMYYYCGACEAYGYVAELKALKIEVCPQCGSNRLVLSGDASKPHVPQVRPKKSAAAVPVTPEANATAPAEAGAVAQPTTPTEEGVSEMKTRKHGGKGHGKSAAKKNGAKRAEYYGNSAGAVIKALGAKEYTFAQAKRVVTANKMDVNDDSIRWYLSAGRTGKRGAPAKLTAEQWAEVKKLAGEDETPADRSRKADALANGKK